MPEPIFLQPVKIAQHTQVYGQESDGHIPIYVREEPVDHGEAKHMVTQWTPTTEQLKQLQSGASVFLSIVAAPDAHHPPVILAVLDQPAAQEASNDEPIIG